MYGDTKTAKDRLSKTHRTSGIFGKRGKINMDFKSMALSKKVDDAKDKSTKCTCDGNKCTCK